MNPSTPQNTSTEQQKSTLRKNLRSLRKCLSQTMQQTAAEAINQRLQANIDFDKIRTIAAYLTTDGEPSLAPLIDDALNAQKSLYLPRLRPFKPNRLWFCGYHQATVLETNKYGIAEPGFDNLIAPSKLHLILMPLVAFDRNGHRLGMGGGFYDRTLAHLTSPRTTKLVGVAYDQQEVDEIPHDPWDIDLDAIVTPTRWIGL